MATLPTRRPDSRTQRNISATSKTVKSARDKRTVDPKEAGERQKCLSIAPRPGPSRFEDGPEARDFSVDVAPLLYAPAEQWVADDVQMFADFFERYYPPSVEVWRQTTYLRRLVDFTPSTPVLVRARRTIGLTHLAVASQDIRLMRESRVSYGRLLGMLQFTLMFPSKIKTANESRELLASIALLTHLSDLPGTAAIGDDSWTMHMLAAQQLFTTYAPLTLPGIDHLDKGIMRHTIMNGFFLAVAKRRAWNVDPAWFVGVESKGWTTLIAAYYRLPQLLEETDIALSRQVDVTALLTIIARLADLRKKTVALFAEIGRPDIMDRDAMHCLDTSAEEHLVMMDSTTFPELLAPMTKNGGVDCFKLLMRSFLSLVLECTLLRIFYFRPESLAALPSSMAPADIEHSAYLMASTLCRMSLSFTRNDKVAYASTLRFCLSLARNVFEQQNKLSEMGWCDACLIANQLRMQRIQKTSAPTLCKIEDITPGIAEAGRYKSKFDPRAFVIRAAQTPSLKLLQ